jgi:hypothetical protein
MTTATSVRAFGPLALVSLAFASVGCTKDTGARRNPPRDAAIARPSDAAIAPPVIVDASNTADTSLVPDEWAPSVRFRRTTSRFGADHVLVPYGESAEVAGITFAYTRHAYSETAQRGSLTVVATKGSESVSHDLVADAEVVVFGKAFMIDGYWQELWIGSIPSPQANHPDCNEFGLAQMWQGFALGGEWKRPDGTFYVIPRGARSFEMDGMFHIDYRGARVSCGTLSGRVFAEHLPAEATP